MVRIRVIVVGKLREQFFRAAAAEYIKRLGSYARAELLEIRSEPDGTSAADVQTAVAREGERILQAIGPDEYVVALAVKGEQASSEELAAWLKGLMLAGTSSIAFVIGGSNGLSPEVYSRAQKRISFGPMTLPHQMVPQIILEQVYRAFKINAGEPYHK
jgi:23S rRNA (pseudouridine1915-N3)-methyltransferase